ncbi:MAG TPA: pyridoxal-phosphate dependent enzyme, partial [Pricia sp.]|nr:pyridoxal-phosphate dependent enzyme [Pricia sp.]
EMEGLQAEIIRIPGSYEDVVRKSSELAQEHGWYDANPGGSNTPLQISAYSQIAGEIFEELGDAPEYCAVPVSNGTLFAGIYRGFVSLYKRGKTSRIPKMVAASSSRKNPIVQSFLQGLDHCRDLDPGMIKETKYNEPLINWHSFDGEEALYALRESKGEAFNISDTKLRQMTSILAKKEGFRILPASTAGLIALLELDEKINTVPGRFVAILTAKH